jgi:hypothetical protein
MTAYDSGDSALVLGGGSANCEIDNDAALGLAPREMKHNDVVTQR